MTFELDTLIALAFFAPIAFFAVLNIVAFRTRGYDSAVKPPVAQTPRTQNPAVWAVEAANDDEARKSA